LSDIFEEVDDSLRQDKIETVWKRYRLFVYGGAALLIGAVALNEFVITPHFAQGPRRTGKGVRDSCDAADQKATMPRPRPASGNWSMRSRACPRSRQTIWPRPCMRAAATCRWRNRCALETAGKADGSPFERVALLKAAYAKADTLSLTELEAMLGDMKEEETASRRACP
jgi:hypothetical protein